MHIFTVPEIRRMRREGWFYGLIRYKGKTFLGEIYPGLGFANISLADKLSKGDLRDIGIDILTSERRKVRSRKR